MLNNRLATPLEILDPKYSLIFEMFFYLFCLFFEIFIFAFAFVRCERVLRLKQCAHKEQFSVIIAIFMYLLLFNFTDLFRVYLY